MRKSLLGSEKLTGWLLTAFMILWLLAVFVDFLTAPKRLTIQQRDNAGNPVMNERGQPTYIHPCESGYIINSGPTLFGPRQRDVDDKPPVICPWQDTDTHPYLPSNRRLTHFL